MTTAERSTDERDGYPPPALTAAVLALIAVVLGVLAIGAIGETAGRAFATYTPTDATVVAVHGEEHLVADRRGSRTETVRVVSVEFADGARADVRSEDLAVGVTATVYRSDSDAVFETPPPRPGVLEWSLCAAIVAATAVLALAAARVLVRLQRSR